ncbi:MAG TPA: amino acid adenylation domain-containing protein [Candidatus Angelobacter sp.]|nr:amino acid adenylation domain-containing protein [Candidatus Angelobacter sp.]
MTGSELNRQGDNHRQVYVFPASFAQQRLWFLYQLDPFSPIYNITAPLQISGPLDNEALYRSLDAVIGRHESLRTVFSSVNGEPVQVISEVQPFELETRDLSSLPVMEQEAEIVRMAREDKLRSFNLRKGPLLRATLLRRAEQQHVLLLAMHHIISDGWSMGILLQEISALYEAFGKGLPSPLPELTIQYADFSEWQRNWLTGEILETQMAYWKKQLEGAPPALDLPTDRPRTTAANHQGAQEPFELSGQVVRKLYHLAREHGATLYMVLSAAFSVLLCRYTGQTDVLVGTPIAGRKRPELEKLIGFFVNTLVIRTHLSGEPDFHQLLERTRETTLAAYAHQDIPFEKLVEVLSPQRNLSSTPIFQVMLVLQNNALPELRLGLAAVQSLESPGETAKFELTLSVSEDETRLRGHLEYKTDLFDPSTIARMAGHFTRLLTGIADAPQQPVLLLPLLADTEEQQLLHEWSGENHVYPLARCVHELFEEHARNYPNQIAAAEENNSLTYAELNCRANQLAHYLRSLHIKPEASVAIFLEPSIEMMIALLGILKAGGSYVPLDPIFPKDRINYILEDSEAQVLLTRKSLQDWIPPLNIHTLFMDECAGALSAYDTRDLPPYASLESRVYMIYTSGSTGRPKGVEVEQRQILSYVNSIVQRFGLRQGAHYAMLQPLAVDSSNTVLFPAICGGGTLHVMPRERAADPHAVSQYFREHHIDVLKIAPSHLAAMLEALPSPDLLPQSVLALGGEASNWSWLQNKVLPLAKLDCKIFIHYGPTETTVGMLTYKLHPDSTLCIRSAPLGKPLIHAGVYLLDGAMQPVPQGVAGEIYIGGQCVARGYFKRPELTAERFLPDPFASEPGGRLYKTGDLGRWLADGDIEFLGRNDHQVKIRGFRIELGEIEAALCEHHYVERALAIAVDDGFGSKQLVAYVVSKKMASNHNGNRLPAQPADDSFPVLLRSLLNERLPSYMVPGTIIVLDKMPLSPQGKVDFQSLPKPAAQSRVTDVKLIRPRTPAEVQLAEIWEEVLHTPVGVTDDFFQVGGHSLLALRMMTLVRNRFHRTLPLASLFRNPTISYLAKLLTDAAADDDASILVEIQPQGQGSPIFCVHPIGGGVLCYWDLAKALGHERPIFGLQAPAASPDQGPLTTIEEIASLYIKHIQRVQPAGPYLLAGWSMGGLIAYEIAQQLTTMGETVGFLGLFDTHPPSNSSSVRVREDLPILAQFGADMMRLAGKDAIGMRDHFLKLAPQEQRQFVFETLHNEGMLTVETELDELVGIFARHSTALEKYSLHQAKHPITLFSTTQSQAQDLQEEWKFWSQSGLNSIEVPGDHYSMIKYPHVEKLAVLLNETLNTQYHEARASIAATGRSQ